MAAPILRRAVPHADNPIYGGAYTYGKTEHLLQYDHGQPRTSSRRRPREEWLAFIPHAHEGYVRWDEFERIRHTMAANVRGWQHTGAATKGSGLLTGLLRCRRCGRNWSSATLATRTMSFATSASEARAITANRVAFRSED